MNMKLRLRQVGLNLIINDEGKIKTITVKHTDQIGIFFELAQKVNQGYKIAEKFFYKQVASFEKPVVKDISVLEARINRKKISKEIKKIQSFDYSELNVYLPEDWITVLKSKEDTTYLENFLMLLSMNKSEWTRNNFLKQFSSKYPYITDQGFLVGVRQCHLVEVNDKLHDFIHSSFIKIKGQKKGPKNYYIIEKGEDYYLAKNDQHWEISSTLIGNLQELKDTYQPIKKSVYCSDYNLGKPEQESWNIGDVIKIHNPMYADDEICGYGRIHIKTDPFSCVGNSEYGDVNIVTITNPSKITGIREDWKYTTEETYLACTITDNEIKETFTEDFGHFAVDYASIDFSEIKTLVECKKKKSLTKYKEDQKSKIKGLKASITNKEYKKVLAQDFNEILRNRINLI